MEVEDEIIIENTYAQVRTRAGKAHDRVKGIDVSETTMVITRHPTMRAIVVLIALVSVGTFIGLMQIPSISGWLLLAATSALALTFWPETQVCELTSSQIRRINRPALLWNRPQSLVYATQDASSVRVNEETLRYASRGRQVVIDFDDGKEVLVTSFCTMDEEGHHFEVAREIAKFLDIPLLEEPRGEEEVEDENEAQELGTAGRQEGQTPSEEDFYDDDEEPAMNIPHNIQAEQNVAEEEESESEEDSEEDSEDDGIEGLKETKKTK